jgi:uncharacterized protein YaeQ
MAPSTTLYRFRIDLSDIERGVYEELDFRLAQHPSESDLYLLTRMLAYCLNWQEGLEFSSTGLSDPEGPCLFVNHPNGRMRLWIEVGNPSSRKLHKATKAAADVKVYTYKNAELMLRDSGAKDIHRASEIGVYGIEPGFLERMAKMLVKDVKWSLLYQDRVLTIGTGDRNEQTEIKLFQFKA